MPLGPQSPVQEPVPPADREKGRVVKYKIALLLVITTVFLGCSQEVPDDSKTFIEKGLFSLSLPNTFVDTRENNHPLSAAALDSYFYRRAEPECAIYVNVLDITADTPEKKQQEIKRYIKKVQLMFRATSDKWTVKEIIEPKDIKDRVQCSITAVDPNNTKAYYKTALIFDKKTYIIQVSSRMSASSEITLDRVINTFKILDE
jgi:hypothetical protein